MARHRKTAKRQAAPEAFTLIELLVVLAIISLLLAILSPSLSKLRRFADETICATDTSTLVEAAIAFATDNDGNMPDLSVHPDTGALLSSAPYWTWPGWRRKFEADYGVSHRHWYSLSNPKWGLDRFYYWGWNGSDPDTATYMVMGRFYFGSERKMNAPGVRSRLIDVPTDSNIKLFPSRLYGKSYYRMLWTDLNRQWPESADDWWVTPGDPDRWGANHLYDGDSGDPDYGNWPRGSHVGYVDGSVNWMPGSEIMYRLSVGGAEMYW